MASNPYQSPSTSEVAKSKRRSWVLMAIGIVAAIIVVVPLTLCVGVLGLIMAEGRATHQRYLREQAEIVPILASDPAFKKLEEREGSGGRAYIDGRVDREEDIENLRRQLSATLGEKRAGEIIGGVHTPEMEDAWNKELEGKFLTSPQPSPRP